VLPAYFQQPTNLSDTRRDFSRIGFIDPPDRRYGVGHEATQPFVNQSIDVESAIVVLIVGHRYLLSTPSLTPLETD
jgi:hypothetical protein